MAVQYLKGSNKRISVSRSRLETDPLNVVGFIPNLQTSKAKGNASVQFGPVNIPLMDTGTGNLEEINSAIRPIINAANGRYYPTGIREKRSRNACKFQLERVNRAARFLSPIRRPR